MSLKDLLNVLEFGARFEICFFDDVKKEVGYPIFHGNGLDFMKDYEKSDIFSRKVKVVQPIQNLEQRIVLLQV